MFICFLTNTFNRDLCCIVLIAVDLTHNTIFEISS